MDHAAKHAPAEAANRLTLWIVSPLLLLLIYGVLGWLDTSTELAPSHDRVLHGCVLAAGSAGLLYGAWSLRRSKGMAAWQRAPLTCFLTITGAMAVFMTGCRVAAIVEAFADFPPAKTKTYPGMLLIGRAYQTYGKGRSWHIEMIPFTSDFYITETDYKFMLAHRKSGKPEQDQDEIAGNGFCAQVMMQQSGNAVRVLHAGSQKLPAGTIVICPAASTSTLSKAATN